MTDKPYDLLVVGAGLYGATAAWKARRMGLHVLVVDYRSHLGGNAYTSFEHGICVHKYGAHIFHTDDEEIWKLANGLVRFKPFINSPLARFHDRTYHLPFNMNTFKELWGTETPEQAREIIERQREQSGISTPRNLEEQAISMVGRDVYETLIKGYTEKQWGRKCDLLPASIIKRIPVRFSFDNNYFNSKYQGIPEQGYTTLVEKLLEGCEVMLECDFLKARPQLESISELTLYTGAIDRFYDYQAGRLEYRSLRFEEEFLEKEDFQGNAVVNYTDSETPFTRIIEHKHFLEQKTSHTIITREYPVPYNHNTEAYYPVNDSRNTAIMEEYRTLSLSEPRTIFGGRLAQYRYYDMDQVMRAALDNSALWDRITLNQQNF